MSLRSAEAAFDAAMEKSGGPFHSVQIHEIQQEPQPCPFQVGDRVASKLPVVDSTKPAELNLSAIAVVTEASDHGFDYTYEVVQHLYHGYTSTGGRCLPRGFDSYGLVERPTR